MTAGRAPGRASRVGSPDAWGGGGQHPAPCLLHARVSPGVYAFGFLFMLPQLFVNYKVRGAPSPMGPTPLGRHALTRPVSLSPDEVSGPPALEGLHLQGQCVACTRPLGTVPRGRVVSAVLLCRGGGGRGEGFSLKHRAPGWPWKPGVPAQPHSLPSDSHAASCHHASYGGWMLLTRGLAPGAGSLSTRRRLRWSQARAAKGCLGMSWPRHVQRLAPHDPRVAVNWSVPVRVGTVRAAFHFGAARGFHAGGSVTPGSRRCFSVLFPGGGRDARPWGLCQRHPGPRTPAAARCGGSRVMGGECPRARAALVSRPRPPAGLQHLHRRRIRLYHHHAHLPPAGLFQGRCGVSRVPVPAVVSVAPVPLPGGRRWQVGPRGPAPGAGALLSV